MRLEQLAAHTGQLTVTLTAPGDDVPGVRDALATTVGNLLRRAVAEVLDLPDLSREERSWWQETLEAAAGEADRVPARHGLWLAVSEDLGIVSVPLSPGVRVTEQVALDHRVGLVRPLLEHEQQPRELLVLTLAGDESDLAVLELETRALTPVGEPFPLTYAGDGGRQGREAGSRQRDERRRHHWRRLAEAAHREIVARDLPVVVVGVDRNLGFLSEVSSWPDELAVPVVVAPDRFDTQELIDRVIAAADEHRQRRVEDARQLVAARRGAGRVAEGLTDLYAAAVAGRIELLVLVAGPPVSGFLTASGHLVREDPGDATPVPDVHALGLAEAVLRGARVVLAPQDTTLDAPVATLRW